MITDSCPKCLQKRSDFEQLIMAFLPSWYSLFIVYQMYVAPKLIKSPLSEHSLDSRDTKNIIFARTCFDHSDLIRYDVMTSHLSS